MGHIFLIQIQGVEMLVVVITEMLILQQKLGLWLMNLNMTSTRDIEIQRVSRHTKMTFHSLLILTLSLTGVINHIQDWVKSITKYTDIKQLLLLLLALQHQ